MKKTIHLLSLSFMALIMHTVHAAPPAQTPELLAKGEAAYKTNCVTCHGDKGDSMGPAGQYMNPKPRNFAKDKFKAGTKVEDIFKTLTEGLKGTTMTGYAHVAETDRWAMSYYVLKLKGETPAKK